jgi:hypothetical protein
VAVSGHVMFTYIQLELSCMVLSLFSVVHNNCVVKKPFLTTQLLCIDGK